MALANEIEHALSEIIDPETGLSLTRMDVIHDLEVTEDGRVSLVFRPASPICPMAFTLANQIKKRIESLDKAREVRIKVQNFNRANELETVLNVATRKQ